MVIEAEEIEMAGDVILSSRYTSNLDELQDVCSGGGSAPVEEEAPAEGGKQRQKRYH